MGSDKQKKKLTAKEKEKLRQLLQEDSDSSSEEEPQPQKKVKTQQKNDDLSSISEKDEEDNNQQDSSSEEEIVQKQQPKKIKKGALQLDGSYQFDLDDPKKKVTVSKFKNKTYISIREFYQKDSEYLPTKKGISLTTAQWKLLKHLVNDIDSAVEQIF